MGWGLLVIVIASFFIYMSYKSGNFRRNSGSYAGQALSIFMGIIILLVLVVLLTWPRY